MLDRQRHVAARGMDLLYNLLYNKSTTQSLNAAVFEKVNQLVPSFTPLYAMADFEEAPVAAFKSVYVDANVAGCWFHYAQAIIKRVQKIGIRDAYHTDAEVGDTVRCLLGLPLLPSADISAAFDDVEMTVTANGASSNQLRQLIAYVRRQWITKRSIGPERLSVRDNRSRTNNVVESYHAALRRRIQVSHPNMFQFLGHLQRATADYVNDMARVTNGLPIRRAKKKANILNEKRIKSCIARYDAGVYTRLQFLRAASHSLGAHADALQPQSSTSSDSANEAEPPTATVPAPVSAATNVSATTSSPPSVDAPPISDCCQVWLVAPRSAVALVPCGHAQFCTSCVDTLVNMAVDSCCPICRGRIDTVLRIFT